MKKLLLTFLLLGSSMAFARNNFYFGVSIGGPGYYPGGYVVAPPPPPPPAYYGYGPVVASPGPGYVWVPGYYAPGASGYGWIGGAWQRPPRGRSVWIAPRHHRGRYYNGYWR